MENNVCFFIPILPGTLIWYKPQFSCSLSNVPAFCHLSFFLMTWSHIPLAVSGSKWLLSEKFCCKSFVLSLKRPPISNQCSARRTCISMSRVWRNWAFWLLVGSGRHRTLRRKVLEFMVLEIQNFLNFSYLNKYTWRSVFLRFLVTYFSFGHKTESDGWHLAKCSCFSSNLICLTWLIRLGKAFWRENIRFGRVFLLLAFDSYAWNFHSLMNFLGLFDLKGISRWLEWNDDGFLGWFLGFYESDSKLNNHCRQNKFFQNPIAYLSPDYFGPTR